MPSAVDEAMKANRYPGCLQDVVHETQEGVTKVVWHKAWYRFSDGTNLRQHNHPLLLEFWPLLEVLMDVYLILTLVTVGGLVVIGLVRIWGRTEVDEKQS